MKKLFSFLIALTLVISSFSAPALGAVKTGAKCLTKGETKISQGKKFKCIKSGQKLVWNKGVIMKPTPTPAPTPTPTPATTPVLTPISTSPNTDFEPTSICKLSKPANLPMNDGERGSVGFPRDSDAISAEGSYKALLLLIDFPDVVADATLASKFQESIPVVEKFFAGSSYSNFQLTIEPTAKVYRLQNTSTLYNLFEAPEGGPIAGSIPKLQDLLLDSMAAADKDIDFSKYLFITVAAPLSKTLTLSGAFGLSPSATEKFDGVKYNFASFSPLDSVFPVNQYNKNWNWTHDIAHMLGLMHPFERDDRIAWDIMYNFAPQPDFMGWNKWKLNWITDDQVYCLKNSMNKKVVTLLSPVGVTSQLKKILVIQSNPAYALVVEVRRETSFDRSSFLKEQGGVIVYRVDTTKQGNTGSPNAGPFKILSNLQKTITYVSNDSNQIPYTIGTMKPGESMQVEGVRIEVLQSTAEGDYVSVSKVNG